MAAGLLVVGCSGSSTASRHAAAVERARPVGPEAEVSPGEDLMQEHGVLERVLLIYGEASHRIEQVHPLDLAIIKQAAQLVRHFVEDYHEQNEEDFIFPRLEKAEREVALIAILRQQHARGRELTDDIIRIAGTGPADAALGTKLRAFERMYRPHAAREETVLFPAFRHVIGGAGYRELGEQLEQREIERFGAHGFDEVVGEVARLEAALAIDDLTRMTP